MVVAPPPKHGRRLAVLSGHIVAADESLVVAAAPVRKPRLIHHNDSRHYSMYRCDPPMSLHQLRQPVDEVQGTSVDMLAYGLASGATFGHEAVLRSDTR